MLADKAGVPVRTARQLAKRGFNTKTTDTLKRIERALDEIEGDALSPAIKKNGAAA